MLACSSSQVTHRFLNILFSDARSPDSVGSGLSRYIWEQQAAWGMSTNSWRQQWTWRTQTGQLGPPRVHTVLAPHTGTMKECAVICPTSQFMWAVLQLAVIYGLLYCPRLRPRAVVWHCLMDTVRALHASSSSSFTHLNSLRVRVLSSCARWNQYWLCI